MAFLTKTWEFVLDILFPPICLSCRRYLEEKEKPNLICGSCFNGIKIYKNLFHPLPQFTLAAATSYEDKSVRELIHYFKYESFLQAKKPLGEILIKYLSDLNLHLENSIVVPIPLHPSRKRKRGFNQAKILAEIISKHFGWQLETNILKRTKETKPQIEMKNHEDREVNIKNCFEVMDKNTLQNKNIILVDDVYTSGATIKEAVKILKRDGAANIIALAVAKV